MPSVIVTLTVMVTMNVPARLAGGMTRADLKAMARAACPDSCEEPGAPTCVQVVVKNVGQEHDGEQVMANVFAAHDILREPLIEFEEAGFTTAEAETHPSGLSAQAWNVRN